jgi:hypothetical protein
MQMITKFYTVIVMFTLVGCATTMSDQASRIRIITAEEAKQCDFIGLIEGASNLSGVARHTGYQNALNEVLDKAAAKGANSVALDPRSKPAYWTTSQIIRAEAFKCLK